MVVPQLHFLLLFAVVLCRPYGGRASVTLPVIVCCGCNVGPTVVVTQLHFLLLFAVVIT